jgi:hypothetical protein
MEFLVIVICYEKTGDGGDGDICDLVMIKMISLGMMYYCKINK